jgi:hypothetical protein
MNEPFLKSDFGYCVWVLFYKRWGKTPFEGKLRSQTWWQNRLNQFVDVPETTIPAETNLRPGIYDQTGHEIPPSARYEDEFTFST